MPKFLIADGDEKGKEYVKKALEKGYKKDQEVFALEYQDIFFEVENKLLIDAIIELLTRLSEESIIKNEKTKEVIEKLHKEQLIANTKENLKDIFSDIEKKAPKWTIWLADILARKLNKPEDLKQDIKSILIKIDSLVREYSCM